MTCTSESYIRRPGKFEASGEMGERLYELLLDGADEEAGSVSEVGWFAALLLDTGLSCAPHAILMEDDAGFVFYESFDDAEAARAAFAEYEREYLLAATSE